jgi:nitroimidazol reductase NimA-like FMN-containing flavoprotein (pyridoxamine 5'-phosphate oxidase superfamily)
MGRRLGVVNLDDIKKDSRRYGPFAYIATTGKDGEPHLAPVAVNWIDDEVVAFVLSSSRKVRNVRQNPRATVHFSVGESTNWDSCIVWGDARIVDTTEGRRELWDKMGYDLTAFEPGGPEADTHVFLVVEPTRATVLRSYGAGGRSVWKRGH